MPKRIEIDADVLARLEAQCPKYLSTTSFANLLIDQGLDNGFMLGKPSATKAAEPERGEGFTSSSNTSSKSSLILKSIPLPLEKHEDLIREFWRGKGGSKSETAWKLLMTELEKLQTAHGADVVREQLQLAINGKWKGVSLRLYEQFKAPKGNAPPEPAKHPAGRVFTAADFDTPNPDNPLKDLF